MILVRSKSIRTVNSEVKPRALGTPLLDETWVCDLCGNSERISILLVVSITIVSIVRELCILSQIVALWGTMDALSIGNHCLLLLEFSDEPACRVLERRLALVLLRSRYTTVRAVCNVRSCRSLLLLSLWLVHCKRKLFILADHLLLLGLSLSSLL